MKKTQVSKGVRTAGSVAIIILFIIIIASSGTNDKKENSTNSQNTQANSTTSDQIQQAKKISEEVNDINTTNQTEVAQANKKNSDIESLNLSPQGKLYKVVEVVDGDTIKVLIDGSVKTLRLIGIDTPETVDPRKTVQCFGKEASNKAKDLLLNKNVRLEVDSTQGELDKYQRLLRYVFVEDGTFFNKWMIENGYAHEYTYQTPYKYQAEFKAAEKSARESQNGLWNLAVCPVTQPAQTQTVSQPTQPSGHTFYLSTYYTSKNYYCDTDETWKSLSPRYLKSYTSEQSLLANYPTRILHEPCK